ncbi:MAG: hypothetical protein WKF66_11380 [Pedobacter sp.]
MKKIGFIIAALFIAIVTMAYLYFSGLSSEHKKTQHSLYVAAAHSPLIFSFENEQSIVDILKGQNVLQDLIGEEKIDQLTALTNNVLGVPGVQKFFERQSVYISLHPGDNKSFSFLYSTQINPDFTTEQLLQTLAIGKVVLTPDLGIFKMSLNDSTNFFIGMEGNLLLLSTESKLVKRGLTVSRDQQNKFAEFIQANSRIAKTSLAELYLNIEKLPHLLKVMMPGKLPVELTTLDRQNAYAALVYNFSKEKVLLTGTTVPQSSGNYYSIFANETSQKIDITNILPDNTAIYTAYAVANHLSFRRALKQWFKENQEVKEIDKTIENINTTNRIDLEKVLPAYFRNQFITFQLSSSEKLAAVNLTNGDKLDQLLLELSTNYSDEIKRLKVAGLLYAFFGEPFRNFQRPYYLIIDNYMIIANSPETLASFSHSYRNNELLINNGDFSNAVEQLSAGSNIEVYVDFKNSANIAQKNIYLPFFRHIYSKEGLKDYSSLSYQLSSDNKKFLTNLLMVKKQAISAPDSLSIMK